MQQSNILDILRTELINTESFKWIIPSNKKERLPVFALHYPELKPLLKTTEVCDVTQITRKELITGSIKHNMMFTIPGLGLMVYTFDGDIPTNVVYIPENNLVKPFVVKYINLIKKSMYDYASNSTITMYTSRLVDTILNEYTPSSPPPTSNIYV